MTHYVRYNLSTSDWPRPEFKCDAPEDAECRTVCKLCILEEGNERCECDDLEIENEDGTFTYGREPVLEHGQDCNVLAWLENGDPEETYEGPDCVVRGPDWAPIEIDWPEDYCTWHYPEENKS